MLLIHARILLKNREKSRQKTVNLGFSCPLEPVEGLGFFHQFADHLKTPLGPTEGYGP